jgi:hypothetical protein
MNETRRRRLTSPVRMLPSSLPTLVALLTVAAAAATLAWQLVGPLSLDPRTTRVEVSLGTSFVPQGYVYRFREGGAELVDYRGDLPPRTESVPLPDDVWRDVLRRSQSVEPGGPADGCMDAASATVRITTRDGTDATGADQCATPWAYRALLSVADPAADLFSFRPE